VERKRKVRYVTGQKESTGNMKFNQVLKSKESQKKTRENKGRREKKKRQLGFAEEALSSECTSRNGKKKPIPHRKKRLERGGRDGIMSVV